MVVDDVVGCGGGGGFRQPSRDLPLEVNQTCSTCRSSWSFSRQNSHDCLASVLVPVQFIRLVKCNSNLLLII